MNKTIPTGVATKVLDATAILGRVVWFQNFNTAAGFFLRPGGTDPTADDYFLPEAADADHPSELVIQSSGGDTTLVNSMWKVLQSSGGDLGLKCDRW